KGVLRAERNHDRIVRSRCLQFEIERAAKTFSQRQTPGAIDSIAERRMQDQLHSTRFIEETLHYQSLLRRNRVQGAIGIREIVSNLSSALGGQCEFRLKPMTSVPVV